MTFATTPRIVSPTFDDLAADWNRIYASMPASSAFDSLEWNRIWWEHFGGDSKLMLRSVVRPNGTTAIIAPLRLDSNNDEGVCTFLGGTDLVDYLGFKHDAELLTSDVQDLLQSLYDDPEISALVLESLPEDSHTIHAVKEVASDMGWEVHIWDEGVAPRVTLPSTVDEYFASLTKKHRHELRRKLRRLHNAGKVEQLELTTPDEIEQGMNDFIKLHRGSSIDKEEFMTPQREAFFREIAVTLAEKDVTRIYFLTINGEKVATSLAFKIGSTKYLYNSGYLPDRSWLAVGLLNHAINILASIREGIEVYDFMRGDERYKYHLGAVDRHIYTARLDKKT
ncbi:MAG: GNAT family N-acetyltransferase [Chloroflexi bacterium]|nr:GNAT family N-acetyltransferase [Chloroflexota bacterium]